MLCPLESIYRRFEESILDLLDTEDKGETPIRNIGISLPVDTM